MDDSKSNQEISLSTNDDAPLQVTICGGGNGGHAFALTLAASFEPRFRVNWLLSYQDEMERVEAAISKNGGYMEGFFRQENIIIKSKPDLISKDASKVIPNSDIVLICAPSFAHRYYLDAIKQHHEVCNGKSQNNDKKLLIVAFPCGSGFDIECFGRIGLNNANIGLFGGDTLPWACRLTEYGSKITILGIKSVVVGYVRVSDDFYLRKKSNAKKNNNEKNAKNEKNGKQETAATSTIKIVQSFFLDNKPKINCDENVHFLSSTLRTKMIHSSILYDKWHNYDKKEEFDNKPLFYQGITKEGVQLLCDISDECGKIIKEINNICIKKGYFKNDKEYIKFLHEKDWFIDTYWQQAIKKDTLYDIIRTNPSYDGLTHPMIQLKNGKYKPDLDNRYFTEDIPFSLLNMKAIACLLVESGYDIKVPICDKVLLWAQYMMDKKYVFKNEKNGYVDIDINSNDVKKTRIPQVYGIKTIDQLLKMHST